MNTEDIIKAGEIAKQVKTYARSFIKKDMLLLEIAEKIEAKIIELGGKPAFPATPCINDIAAHYTPSHDDESKAQGLLKIDFGVHIDGWTADTAFSIDLENTELNRKLIQASEQALQEVEKKLTHEITLAEIGKTIEQEINKHGFTPIVNLSGHSMEQYDLHSGITIPNIDNNADLEIGENLYAIEPFASNGSGRVHNGNPSGIYELRNPRNIRSPIAREVLEYITENYQTLPFCSRWLVKKFGTKALLALRQLEQNENLHHFPQLIETSGSIVSQAENTFLVKQDKVVNTTGN